QPMLGAFNTDWYGDRDNWDPPLNGKGKMFGDYVFELAPETMVVDCKPVKYPRAPVGYRRTWVDTRNQQFASTIRYDRNGKKWVSFEAGLGQRISPDGKVKKLDKHGHPEWSWMYVHSYDVQRERMSRIMHSEHCYGGYKSLLDADNEEMYDKWFTQEAIQRLGAV
ncbi:MAG: DUF1329 domain-containing protein, partial [Sinobacteraceae bacterium]|nr:DUF1329 domain-containing protein [Nevskiaceae bacterium]